MDKIISRFTAGLILLLFAIPGGASVGGERPHGVSRDVLALYNSSDGSNAADNNIRLNAEAVLNHLGLNVTYHDVSDGLPDASEMRRYRGIITWFESEEMNDAAGYWRWLEANIQAGRRVVLLNNPGPVRGSDGRPVKPAVINKTLGLIGLSLGAATTDNPLDIELLKKDAAMVEFERRLTNELTTFRQFASRDPRNRVFLTLGMKSSGARSDAVVLVPQGGVALNGYVYALDGERRQWRIDPFRFFADAFGVQNMPRPDATTLNGRRIFYSHVDGDGFRGISYLDRASLCGEILYRSVLATDSDLPISVSVIGCEVDPAFFGRDRALAAARAIFALPNIEPASHTFSHPLIWNRALSGELTANESIDDMDPSQAGAQTVVSFKISSYAYDPERETIKAVRAVDALLPAGRKCSLLFWSGNCLPDAVPLELCDQAGIRTINGGDGVFDGEYPSYCHVAPLYRRVGGHIQVHSSASNENLYTNLWTGPYGGFQNVIRTFINTESPRRISPINIYYHFYSADGAPGSLQAVKTAYAWARTQSIFPIFTSRYIDVVKGFISTRIVAAGPNAWTVRDNGECRTIRWDNCSLYPDLALSRGILGYDFHQGNLYVFLDESPEHTIVLTARRPARPALLSSSADVLGLRQTGDGFTFRSSALQRAEYEWQNLPPRSAWRVNVRTAAGDTSIIARSDSDGYLSFEAPLIGDGTISVRRAS